MVMSRALIAIPPSPRRCRVLRPAFSTRNSWKTQEKVMSCWMRADTHAGVERNTDDSYRNNSEDGVDKSGSNGGVDWLFYTSWVKDACRVVEHLKDTDRTVTTGRVLSLHFNKCCRSKYIFCQVELMNFACNVVLLTALWRLISFFFFKFWFYTQTDSLCLQNSIHLELCIMQN